MNNITYTDIARVESSLCRIIAYNRGTKDLIIMMNNGGVAVYEDVPLDTYQNMVTSNSVGAYYNSVIKGYYVSKFGGTIYNYDISVDTTFGQKTEFVVRGVIPVKDTINASNEEEARETFEGLHPGAFVTEVHPIA